MTLRLHIHPGTSGLAPHAALLASGAAFDIVTINIFAGEQTTPAFKALNPFGVVPVLENGATVIAETGAILLNIAESFPQAGLLPVEGPAHHLAIRWLFHAAALHADIMTWRRADFALKSDAAARTTVQDWMARRLDAAFRAAEQAMVGPAVAGDAAGIADLYIFMIANWWRPRFDFPAETPRLAAAMQTMARSPYVRDAYGAQNATVRDFAPSELAQS